MVHVSVHGDRVHLDVERWDKLWALRSSLEVPLAHVREVRADPDAARGWWHGFRMAGTHVPGLLTAGNFYQAGEGWVHDPERTIVLELDDERYRRLVIEVADPPAVVAHLQAQLQAHLRSATPSGGA